jgi:hypothetical protein
MYWHFDLKIREQFIVSAFSLTVWQTYLHILINVYWNEYGLIQTEQTLCNRSRCLEENPVFLSLSKKKKWKKRILPKFASTCSLFDCRSFPIWNLKLMRIILIFWSCKRYSNSSLEHFLWPYDKPIYTYW